MERQSETEIAFACGPLMEIYEKLLGCRSRHPISRCEGEPEESSHVVLLVRPEEVITLKKDKKRRQSRLHTQPTRSWRMKFAPSGTRPEKEEVSGGWHREF
ncbi:hypothetical protein NPIL_169201 [Nephila pilipes]|uniref:Uncharacterized protein n=1 Tax=Nephila pilipes TaxID=299642 RepID=A0A8X6Q5M7_NEPPI|nr:hypothetical protein NPIL_169201 [Nephila pilipes]